MCCGTRARRWRRSPRRPRSPSCSTELSVHNIGAMVVVVAGRAGRASCPSATSCAAARASAPSCSGVPVSEIMTTLVATCSPDDTVDSLSALMTDEPGAPRPGAGRRPAHRHRQHRRRRQDAHGGARDASSSSCRPTSPRADIERAAGYRRPRRRAVGRRARPSAGPAFFDDPVMMWMLPDDDAPGQGTAAGVRGDDAAPFPRRAAGARWRRRAGERGRRRAVGPAGPVASRRRARSCG